MPDYTGFDITPFKIDKIPESGHYIPGFITYNEEEFLMKEIYAAPKPRWTQLAHRRLQNWGGIPHANGMIAEQLPHWFDNYMCMVNSLLLFGGDIPNHILVNEYEPGQGIMPHFDGPLFHPAIATLSLGSHTVLNLYNEDNTAEPIHSLWLEPRSLLVLRGDLYHKYMHGISDVSQDEFNSTIANPVESALEVGQVKERTTRVSLTIRYVPKTTKPMIRLGR